MPRRELSETGCYHVTARTAGQIALFEDDDDRRYYLRLLRDASREKGLRILAWVLMTDHVHIVVDSCEEAGSVSEFMYQLDKAYAGYFNAKAGRSGHLFQGTFWSKPIKSDAQLVATVYYVHMNPERARMAPMREYRWSSYQEYSGKHWVVDTSVVLGLFGSFEEFDRYEGSNADVVKQFRRGRVSDEDALRLALDVSGCQSSRSLRMLPAERRNEVIALLCGEGVPQRIVARVMGMGVSSVSRIAKHSGAHPHMERSS